MCYEICMIEIETTTTEVPITDDMLPMGPLWEADGCCWRIIKCNPRVEGCERRWQPLNWEAFSKGEPDSEVTDYARPTWFDLNPLTADNS